MLDKNSFIQELSKVKHANSMTGNSNYTIEQIVPPNLYFKRKGKIKIERISTDELYQVYTDLSHINTVKVRDFITGYCYSPTVAILTEAGLYDKKGYRTNKIN